MVKRPLDYFSDCVPGYPTLLAVLALEPIGERLGSLAGIAREAAPSDIVPIDDPCVVNDVFPGRCASPGARSRGKVDAAIDALPISFLHLSLASRECSNYSPLVGSPARGQSVPNLK